MSKSPVVFDKFHTRGARSLWDPYVDVMPDIPMRDFSVWPILGLALGVGVDSVAVLAGWRQRNIRPDFILTADTGDEKDETYEYLVYLQDFLKDWGFPAVTVVRNVVTDFKHWPKYTTLAENCLTNGTLPSLAFGFKSCSLKWKVTPQNKFTETIPAVVECRKQGIKVIKAIGYDAGPKDAKRYAHVQKDGLEDPDYTYIYPLVDWGWDRPECMRQIVRVGLKVPMKSACYHCPATQPAELHEFKKEYLRRIVILEARAKPRLIGCMNQAELDAYNAEDLPRRTARWEEKMTKAGWVKIGTVATGSGHSVWDWPPGPPAPAAVVRLLNKRPQPYKLGDGCAGLWRARTKKKPAMMTEYILAQGLLPADEVAMLQERAPKEIIDGQQAFANGEEIPDWQDFLEMFDAKSVCQCGGGGNG